MSGQEGKQSTTLLWFAVKTYARVRFAVPCGSVLCCADCIFLAGWSVE